MYDKHDARTLLKTAMGVAKEDELKHGVRADDVRDMFKYVQALYEVNACTTHLLPSHHASTHRPL